MNNETTTPTPPEPKGKPFYLKPRFIMGAIAGIIFLILIIQNSQRTVIDVFFWEANAPAALLYLIFSLLGFTVGWLVCRSQNARAKRAKK
ncbi:MAG: lipopolysaccharide assembly protein LapA domain-containing protein [Phycisphaerales bacterium]